jgi:hypothetical protein
MRASTAAARLSPGSQHDSALRTRLRAASRKPSRSESGTLGILKWRTERRARTTPSAASRAAQIGISITSAASRRATSRRRSATPVGGSCAWRHRTTTSIDSPRKTRFDRLGDGHRRQDAGLDGTGCHRAVLGRVLTSWPVGCACSTACRSSTATATSSCGAAAVSRSCRPGIVGLTDSRRRR